MSPSTTPLRAGRARRESATTVAGLAAERRTLAARDRDRQTQRARIASLRLGERVAAPKP
jgi:hypothetical protein